MNLYNVTRYLKSGKPVMNFMDRPTDAHYYLDRLLDLKIQATLTNCPKICKFDAQRAKWAAKQIKKAISTKRKLSKKKKKKTKK